MDDKSLVKMRNYVNHRRDRETHVKSDPDWVDYIFDDAQLVYLHQVVMALSRHVVDRQGVLRELRGHRPERPRVGRRVDRTSESSVTPSTTA